MSQPTNGGYEGQGNSLGQQFGDQQNQQGGSLGSEYGSSSWGQNENAEQQTQQFSAPGSQQSSYDQSGYGQQGYQQQPYEQQGSQASPGAAYGQDGSSSYDQQNAGAAGYGQQQNYSSTPAKPSSPSVFSDTKFEHVLTPKIASLTFLLVSAAAVLWGLTDIIHGFMGDAWSGQGAGDVTVKMKVFPAILNLFADLAIVGAVIFGARLLIELAVNVAKGAESKSAD